MVRLKSGDPSVFARGAEEMGALREAGIAFEVVPGITAALGAAAAAQIPLTDRRSASRLILATAHHAAGKPATNARGLASLENTIALYMPNNNYAQIAEDFMSGGLSPRTPCLVVSRASRSEQQFYPTSLGDLPDVPDLPSPTVVIVGEVTAQFSSRQRASADDLSFTEAKVETAAPGYLSCTKSKVRPSASSPGASTI